MMSIQSLLLVLSRESTQSRSVHAEKRRCWQYRKSTWYRWTALLITALLWPCGYSLADYDDVYQYDLRESRDVRVCEHMLNVYNMKFRIPFPSVIPDDDRRNQGYPFTRLNGVEYDRRAVMQMRFSKWPISPEFEAIQWHEGRMLYPVPNDQLEPILVTELDINNDGRPETVLKTSFMLSFSYAHGSVPGGEDALWVFEQGALDLTKSLSVKNLFERNTRNKKPARIEHPGYRIIRPFILYRKTYLSIYEQDWDPDSKGLAITNGLREYMRIVLYTEGREILPGGDWSPLKVDEVCRFRMRVVK